MESLQIKRDHPPLNHNKQSLPLELEIVIHSSCCNSFILSVILLSHEFCLAKFNIVGCDNVVVILKQNVNFSFIVYSLIIAVVSFETLEELK